MRGRKRLVHRGGKQTDGRSCYAESVLVDIVALKNYKLKWKRKRKRKRKGDEVTHWNRRIAGMEYVVASVTLPVNQILLAVTIILITKEMLILMGLNIHLSAHRTIVIYYFKELVLV